MREIILDENETLIGENHTRENGEWSHKWYIPKEKGFERGSWNGKAKGNEMNKWIYIKLNS